MCWRNSRQAIRVRNSWLISPAGRWQADTALAKPLPKSLMIYSRRIHLDLPEKALVAEIAIDVPLSQIANHTQNQGISI